ncbi:MAG: AAA family ATPase [Sideroxyarcus sp.]|nr:AAA family ATPase [Sideroxyarcus sp.]
MATQRKLIAALHHPQCYPHAVKRVRVIETHISWLLLAGKFAYKVKKAVDLGFLDYTGLAARKYYCTEEIRLNQRTAPDIYLDVVSLGGSPDAPAFGAEPVLEYAVRMRRFAADALLDRCLMRGDLLPRHIDQLSATIAGFHGALPRVADASYGTAETIHAAALQNFEQMRALLHDDADQVELASLQHATEVEFAACRSFFELRRAQGFVRECHGDLHLGNIALIDGKPVPFDGIEFNPALRWIDGMSEVAFTMMDLLHHGRPDYAWRFLNGYLEASGDYAGVGVLGFYLTYRAAVRAKVSAIRSGQAGISARTRADALHACRCYLALAQRCLQERQPVLIITHGLPGSGKTTFAQYVIEQMGAIRIRSDVERKRLHGLHAGERSRGDIYGTTATAQTYTRLYQLAQSLLQAGHRVIVDAAFLNQAEREQFRRLAQDRSTPFVIASLHASDAALHQRLVRRQNDASEADVAVLKKLCKVEQPLSFAERARAVRFSTAQAPDSKANAQSWRKLTALLSAA